MASGTNTTRIPTIQISDSRPGWWAGKPRPRSTPAGALPHRSRNARTIEEIGFQSATGRSPLGNEAVEMNALDRNVSGKIQIRPALCATSTLFTDSPITADTQLIA